MGRLFPIRIESPGGGDVVIVVPDFAQKAGPLVSNGCSSQGAFSPFFSNTSAIAFAHLAHSMAPDSVSFAGAGASLGAAGAFAGAGGLAISYFHR